MLTREPWLGDALRALSALAPDDDETARKILLTLSLPPSRKMHTRAL